MRLLILSAAFLSLAFAGDQWPSNPQNSSDAESGHGIRPRPAATDYGASVKLGNVIMAASLLKTSEVKKLFAADLDAAGYMVVEVAFYPEAGASVQPATRDFMIKAGRDAALLRPSTAQAVASSMTRGRDKEPKIRPPVDVTVVNTVGYGTGGYDPATGRRGGGVYTGTAVGVGVGGNREPPTPAGPDHSAIELELRDKALPQGRSTDAVAGYLYFPKPKGKASPLVMTWYGPDGELRVTLK